MVRIMKLLFLPLILLAVLGPASPHARAESPDIGAIPLVTSDGDISLDKLRGKVVYLDFWASWCVPCRKSFPWMNEMHRKYSDQGLVILAVNVDTKPLAAAQFLEKIPADFTVAYDPDGKLAALMMLKAMPGSYIIAADGNVTSSHIGFMEKMIPEYEKSVRAALGL
jgi:cytochrome c biogenesis protein CcmG/thiol:disulfide interchange protein DsbE